MSPKFILLDEPFAGIDPIAVTDIQKIIFHLKERGIGVLITDHNVRETLRITDRAYIVTDGSDLPERHAGRAWPATKRCGGFISGPTSDWTKIARRRVHAASMAISQKLHTKLVQKLILTPSLQQAIKLLPMSTLELTDLLNQEMVENPMLEEMPTEDSRPPRRRPPKRSAEDKPEPQRADTWDDADYQYFFGEYLDDGYRPRAPQEVKELPPIENTLSTEQLALRPPARGSSRCRPTTR